MQDQLGAQRHAEQHVHGQRKDVERWQHCQEAFGALFQHRRIAARGLEVLGTGCREVGMRQHRTLGQAGGAAGVLQHGDGFQRVALRRGCISAVVVQQLGESDVAFIPVDLGQLFAALHLRSDGAGRGRHFGQVADDELAQPRLAQHAGHLRVQRRHVEREQQVGATVLNLVLEHLGCVQRRIVHRRAAGLEHAKEGNHVVWGIGQEQSDVNAGPYAQLLQTLGRAIGQGSQIPVAQAPAHELQRGVVGPFAHGLVQDAGHQAGSQFHIPSNALGVGLQPLHFGH